MRAGNRPKSTNTAKNKAEAWRRSLNPPRQTRVEQKMTTFLRPSWLIKELSLSWWLGS